MKPFVKLLGAAVAGIVVWFVVATVIDRGMRAAWPAYAEVWVAMTFTTPMLVARLLIGAVCSVVGGLSAGAIARQGRRGATTLVVLLLLVFVPEHVHLWDRFPVWYHVIFLASLAIGPLVGARLIRGRSEQTGRLETRRGAAIDRDRP